MTGRNDEIRRSMRDAGIPDAAIVTTLPNQGGQTLRDHIREKAFVAPTGYRGLYLFPDRPQHAAKARLVFHVAAKELLLSGVTCYCVSLSRLVTALTDDEEGDLDYHRVNSVSMVFVTDFYERGAAFPMEPYQAGVVRSWMKERFENRAAVSLLADAPLMDSGPWWPPSFLGFLGNHMSSFPVTS